MKSYLGILLSFLWVSLSWAQFTIPEKPQKVTEQNPVFDYAEILNKNEVAYLNRKLISYADTTSTQIAIATIPSLKGEDIGILTPKWAHEWGIGGSAQKDNGVFILLAEKERKIWISPGYGVEHILTAGQLGEITRNVIIPEFKLGSYFNGLNKGTSVIMQMLNGTYKGAKINNREGGDFPYMFVIIFIIFILIISSKKNRGNNNRNNGGGRGTSLNDIIILSNMGRGGYRGGSFGGGSSSGGGFGGGFGGGGFSGGGAGGSW